MRLSAFAAEWFVVHHGERRVSHWVSAFHASEAVAMPLGIERDDRFVDDGRATTLAASSELVSIAR